MVDHSTKICRLCLNMCDDYNILQETDYLTLNLLLINLDLKLTPEPVACSTCEKNLNEYFDFKSTCLNVEDNINALVNKSDDFVVDLKKLYLKNRKNSEPFCVGDSFCRFCMNLAKQGSSVCLNDDGFMKTLLQNYFPEINLSYTTEILSCGPCYNLLGNYYTFINNCLNVEEKIKIYCDANRISIVDLVDLSSAPCKASNTAFENQPNSSRLSISGENIDSIVKTEEGDGGINEEKSYSKEANNEFTVKTELLEFIKLEDEMDHVSEEVNVKDDVTSMEERQGITIKQEISDLGTVPGSCDRFDDNVCAVSQSAIEATTVDAEGAIKYGLCVHQSEGENDSRMTHKHCLTLHETTDHRNGPVPHMGSRSEPSDITKLYITSEGNSKGNVIELKTYKCDVCSYQTPRSDFLRCHKRTHQSAPDAITYKCDECPYQGSRKDLLRRHQRSHKTTWKATVIYQCEECPRHFKRVDHLRLHMITHKSSSEITMYKCDVCSHQSKRKDHLRRHMLTHKSASEIPSYKCPNCDYFTKYKDGVRKHLLTHRNPTERRVLRASTK